MSPRLTILEKSYRSISEREWQNHVHKVAVAYGWKYYHAPDNKPVNGRIQRVVAGFPDLVLVKGQRLIFAELKKEIGVLSDAQKDWLDSLQKTGVEVYVWRPSNMLEVKQILSAK